MSRPYPYFSAAARHARVEQLATLSIKVASCDHCGAKPGEACITLDGKSMYERTHVTRRETAQRVATVAQFVAGQSTAAAGASR
jgi:hypothetical protein